MRTHTIQIGDTLASLAKAYYGDPRLLGVIWQSNKVAVVNPNTLYPGQHLIIPTLPVRPNVDVEITSYGQVPV